MSQSVEQSPTKRGRSSDRVVAWLLYVVQLLIEAVLALLALTSVFMTDSCGTNADDPAVCNMAYFGTVFFGYWVILAVAAIGVPILLVVRTRQGRLLWPWAFGSLVTLAGLTVVFVMLMTR